MAKTKTNRVDHWDRSAQGGPSPIYGKRSPGIHAIWDVPLNIDEINRFDMASWTEKDWAIAREAAARFEAAISRKPVAEAA